MPNTPSAFKRMKTSAANRAHNRAVKGEIATVRANFDATAKAGDKASRSAQLKSERNRRYYKKLNDGRLIKTPENALPPTENALNPSESRAPTRVRVLYAEESSSKKQCCEKVPGEDIVLQGS